MQLLRIGIIGCESACFDEFAPRLIELGYDVVGSVDSLSQALDVLEKDQPNVLLVSVNVLEKPQGKEFIELAKQQYRLPVLYTSGQTFRPSTIRKNKLAASDVIEYTIPNDELYNRIETAIEQNESTRRKALAPFHFLKEGNLLTKVYEQHILYIESDNVYLHVFTRSRTMLLRNTVKSLLSQLSPADFMKIHRSCIVNVNHIDSILPDSVVVKGKKLPLSKSHKAGLLERLNLNKHAV